MLTGVTITGADDGVDPRELVALSEEFPFVEWGILFSTKRSGEPRYPSQDWANCAGKKFYGVRYAIHMCGQAARETLAGSERWLPSRGYCRVQLNGWARQTANTGQLSWHAVRRSVSFILQCCDAVDLQHAANDAAEIECAEILYDPSGGRGIEAIRWPAPPRGARLGYAGGITPDNVEQVIADIAAANLHAGNDWWIDMESGVRTDDRLDLAKVRAVLERAKPYLAAGGSR